jgi:hypothetical protein
MTGANFSSWYRADEGTLYGEAASLGEIGRGVSAINDGTGNNRIDIRLLSGVSGAAGFVSANAVTQAAFVGPYSANTFVKRVIAYKVNDFALTTNGTTPSTDTSGYVPVVNQLRIGAVDGGAAYINGTIKKLSYYPARLDNTQLVALTS